MSTRRLVQILGGFHDFLGKICRFSVDTDFEDHKAADDEPKEDGKVDEELKEEIKVEEVENEDQQRDRVMPAVVVPIEEREPEVDLEKLAIVNSPEEEEFSLHVRTPFSISVYFTLLVIMEAYLLSQVSF
ncbi:hypothetical protein ANCCAN_02362 [Ancylostoma caninum]|uniref:Uncharacterized protein n=1 Tax=Ancylostoma caninum TaxID=29170 RepID=A0A368H472_ANCCA|nr:hypothetical protein ANCCAN_02362 [Ancylostoma caninum]